MSRMQVVNELHKQLRKKFDRRHVILKGIDELWQADLVDMSTYMNYNNKYKFILTVIDCFSKYAWALPLKNKNNISVIEAMKTIFETSQRMPKKIQTDLGKEFYNKNFKDLMKFYNIHHYSTYSELKASIVERFNRTLKNKMWKMFSYNGSYKWINILRDLIQDYNKTKHRTIKMAPIEVNSKNVEKHLLRTVFKFKNHLMKNKFKIGDFVRISRYKGVFEKGYIPNWSPEIFEVVAVNNKFPVTYRIKDYQNQIIAGRFYENELQKTADHSAFLIEKVLKRKGDKFFVKWFGFDDNNNSWINKSELLKE